MKCRGSIKQKVSEGLKGHALVDEVLREYENIVNRVTKREVGEKMKVCGKLAIGGGIMK